jgi:hypothetical protein
MVSLILALFWLLLGIAVLVRQFVFDDPGWYLPVGDHRFSWAWVMLLLFGYNVVRWWSVRTSQLQRRRLQAESAIRQSRAGGDQRRTPPEPVNPEFQFTNEPPPPPQADTADQPPTS